MIGVINGTEKELDIENDSYLHTYEHDQDGLITENHLFILNPIYQIYRKDSNILLIHHCKAVMGVIENIFSLDKDTR